MHIETDRLILREWMPEDLPAFARINADPLIMEYFPRTLSEVQTKKLVKRFTEHFKAHNFGFYAAETKDTQDFIGFCGIGHVSDKMPFAPTVEIAWRLDYAYWGKGYGTEAARAVLNHAFTDLDLKEIVAYSVEDNTRALHMMGKLGLKKDAKGGFHRPGLAKDHPNGEYALYRLKKKDFTDS